MLARDFDSAMTRRGFLGAVGAGAAAAALPSLSGCATPVVKPSISDDLTVLFADTHLKANDPDFADIEEMLK